MILFLDVISPIPKFVITDNNNVIESLEILNKNSNKISDIIHSKFLILQKKYNLLDKLNYLIVCTGPGSYTSLRIGISFMLGLSYSNNISIYGITCIKLLSYLIVEKDFYKTFIIICSLNNQNFICLPLQYQNHQYKIIKINDDFFIDNLNLKPYSTCISNVPLPDLINKNIYSFVEKLININLEDKINENLIKNLENKSILKPIYVSDNKLFD